MERKKYKINASGKSVGRLATKISFLLRGKNRVEFLPNVDKGGIVEVENIKEVVFSGKKLEQKKYYHYSGYPGGLKTKKMKDIFTKEPGEVLRRAVYKMLPKNKLRDSMIKRLIIK